MIKVVDSRCGSGKTSYIIDYINALDKDIKVLYITPFLSETERMRQGCSDRNFRLPDTRRGKGSKYRDLMNLIESGENIASTHALFLNVGREFMDLVASKNYILVLDEVMGVVDQLFIDSGAREDVTSNDINTLAKKKIIEIDKNCLVRWASDEYHLSKYDDIRRLIDLELVYYVDKTTLIWVYPPEMFSGDVFKDIFILTYQFDCQIQSYYYQYFNIDYEMYYVEDSGGRNYKLLPYRGADGDVAWRKEIKELITICDDSRLNAVGDYYVSEGGKRVRSALSKQWYMDATDKDLAKVKNNIYNYFRHISESSGEKRLWTCFKDDIKKMKNSYASAKSWLACSCRASNDYADRNVLVYPINRYINPFYQKFFSQRGIKIDMDKYALSELIQWLFRSAIRNGQPVSLYIPSQRMRTLLVRWLDGE